MVNCIRMHGSLIIFTTLKEGQINFFANVRIFKIPVVEFGSIVNLGFLDFSLLFFYKNTNYSVFYKHFLPTKK